MSELDTQIEALQGEILNLAAEVKSKADMPKDRLDAIETQISKLDADLESRLAEKRQADMADRLGKLEARLREHQPSAKAAAILAGANADLRFDAVKSLGQYNDHTGWLKALVDRRTGDPDAVAFVKGVLGTSAATGQAIIPNNFVAGLVEVASAGNIYRTLMNVVTGVRGGGVDIPYEVTEITAALLQGANGSNKDIRDFSFGEATATLYTIAQIADIGNQLLRQSEGAAEQVARRRLGASIARREAEYITNGTGSSQPQGLLDSFMDLGDIAAYKTTLSSEPRAATLGRAFGALESRSRGTEGLAVVLSPTDFWEMATEGLGTSYAGGWAMDPTGGPGGSPVQRVWGVPIYRDPFWPSAYAGTGLAGYFGECDIYLGDEYRIDVSSEAGNRFDQNVTGFRAEEEFGFNAQPYVYTGMFQKILGL